MIQVALAAMGFYISFMDRLIDRINGYTHFSLTVAFVAKLISFFYVEFGVLFLSPYLDFMIVNRRLDEWVKLDQLDLESVETVVDEKVEDKVKFNFLCPFHFVKFNLSASEGLSLFLVWRTQRLSLGMTWSFWNPCFTCKYLT